MTLPKRLISPKKCVASLISRFGETSLYDGGLSVRTTLDPYLQQIADNALERGLEALDRRQGWRGPLGVMPQGADIDKVLAAQTAKLRAEPFCRAGDKGWAATR